MDYHKISIDTIYHTYGDNIKCSFSLISANNFYRQKDHLLNYI